METWWKDGCHAVPCESLDNPDAGMCNWGIIEQKKENKKLERVELLAI